MAKIIVTRVLTAFSQLQVYWYVESFDVTRLTRCDVTGGPETVWALLCAATASGGWGYSSRRHMLEPVRPEAVLPDRALCLPTFSHFSIVNKLLSLSLSLSPDFVFSPS